MTKRLVVTAVIILLMLGLASCGGSSDTPESLLTRFEQANNSRDLQALMNLYDPNAMEFMRGVMDLASGLFSVGGVSVSNAGSNLDAMLPFLSSSFQRYVQDNDVFPTLRLEAITVTMNSENRATIEYYETLISPNGDEATSQQTMNAILVDEVWYIEVSLFPW